MTLIACTLNYKNPFIIGDLMISSEGVEIPASLPTNILEIDPSLIEGNFRKPIGLSQKIYAVKGNVCIGLAGKVVEMISFLEDFRIYCSYFEDKEIRQSHIESFINNYNKDENFNESCFFILLMEYEGERVKMCRQFWYPLNYWKSEACDMFEEVYATGSGMDDFLEAALMDVKITASGQEGSTMRSINVNLGFIARLMAMERLNGDNVKKNWGGGWEMLYFDGNSFNKFDEVAYVILQTQFNSEGEIGNPVPTLILHYRYHNDILLISSIETKKCTFQVEGNYNVIKISHFNARLFAVLPIDRKIPFTNEELPQSLSFTTNKIALGYGIQLPSAKFYPTFYSESNDLSLEFNDGANATFSYRKEIHEIIAKAAKETFPKL